MRRLEICAFSGHKIYPGHGKRYTRVDNRTLYFHVHAEDEKDRIGEGAHERIVINLAKFDLRMQDKLMLIGRG